MFEKKSYRVFFFQETLQKSWSCGFFLRIEWIVPFQDFKIPWGVLQTFFLEIFPAFPLSIILYQTFLEMFPQKLPYNLKKLFFMFYQHFFPRYFSSNSSDYLQTNFYRDPVQKLKKNCGILSLDSIDFFSIILANCLGNLPKLSQESFTEILLYWEWLRNLHKFYQKLF